MGPAELIGLERKYAPEMNKGRGVFSPLDHSGHAPWNLGGDKMSPDRNNYSDAYAELLTLFDGRIQVLVELGVFQGTSLAVWYDALPEASIVGLDLDFSRYEENLPNLKAAGAFADSEPTLEVFDAYDPQDVLGRTLAGWQVDMFVDDGPHREDAIRIVIDAVRPHLAESFLYVVEDFDGGDRILAEAFPDCEIRRFGRLNAAVRL